MNSSDILFIKRLLDDSEETQLTPEELEAFNNRTEPVLFESFADMVNDIIAHYVDLITKNKGPIVDVDPIIICEDSPVQLKIGYYCCVTNKIWNIKIHNVRNYINEKRALGDAPQEGNHISGVVQADLISRAITTHEGRINLGLSLYSQALSRYNKSIA